MRAILCLSWVAVVGLVVPDAAFAQQRSSTAWRTKRADQDSWKMANDDARREFADYARCVVNRRHARARTAVLAPFASSEQSEAVAKVIRTDEDGCLQGGFDQLRMSFRPEVLAGGLAQALVLKDYPDLPAVVGGYTPVLGEEKARGAQLSAAEQFGRCIVYRDPSAVLTLISSVPASVEERQAVDALREDMGSCLAEGSTLTINHMFIRNMTGIAAYRLAQQIRPRGPNVAVSAR